MPKFRNTNELMDEVEKLYQGVVDGTIDPHYAGNTRAKTLALALNIFSLCAARTDKKSKLLKHQQLEK